MINLKRIHWVDLVFGFANKFVKWSEYITVEFDTDAKSVIVVPN